MANITATTLANFVPEIWSKDTLDAVEFGTMIARRVCREYEGEIKEKGDTVHIQHVNNYSAATKSSGVGNPVAFEAMTHGQTNLVIDQHRYAAFQAEKFAERQAMPGYREKQTRKLGYALARDLDVAMSAMFAGFSQSQGTLGVELTDNDYLAAWTQLATAGAIVEASMDEDTSIFLSPAGYAAALKLDKFVNRDYNANDGAVKRAHVGQIYGAETFMSNLLTTNGAGKDCAFMHRDALALAVQQAPVIESDFIIEQLATAVVAHQIYGKVELVRPVETPGSVSTTDNFGVWLKSV